MNVIEFLKEGEKRLTGDHFKNQWQISYENFAV